MDRWEARHEPVEDFARTAQHRDIVAERDFPEPLSGLIEKLKPRPQQQNIRVPDELVVKDGQLRVRGEQQDRVLEAACLPFRDGLRDEGGVNA